MMDFILSVLILLLLLMDGNDDDNANDDEDIANDASSVYLSIFVLLLALIF